MKRLFVALLALILTLSLSACGGEPAAPSDSVSEAMPSSTPISTESANTPVASNGEYKVEIKLIDDKKAAVVIGGAVPTSEMVGTHWGVEFDKDYAVRLDVEDGFYDCFAWKFTSETDKTRVKNMKFSIADDALILYADLSSEADFSLANVKEITLVVDDVADAEFRYDPVTLAMADAVVEEVTVTTAKIEMTASKGESGEVSSQPQESKPASSGSDAAPSNQYVGTYTSSRGTLTVTTDKITVTFDGTSYSTGYQAADIKKDGDIGNISFNSSGTEVQVFFGSDGNTVEVYVGRDGAGFTRNAGAPNAPSSQAPAKGSFSAMAGSYKGQSGDTLTISADGSFTFSAPNDGDLPGDISGIIPADHKSGDPISAGEYTVKLHYGSGATNISVTILDASGKTVGGADMVKG